MRRLTSLHVLGLLQVRYCEPKRGRQVPTLSTALTFLRQLGTLAGAHLSVPRRKNGQPRADDGRDRSEYPPRHFINSLAVRGGDRHT